MKKTITTLALILGLALGATAQGGGLFYRGEMSESSYRGGNSPLLPMEHNLSGDQDANETTLEGGVAAMFALGVLYLTRKRRDD